MKLIISLLFFLLISCEQISKEEVINTIENTKVTIVEKTIKSPDISDKVKIKIEEDKTNKNSLNLWIVSDNLLRGAALNAVEIAETLIKNKNYGK